VGILTGGNMPVEVTWLGHASVMIRSTLTVYIDPWKIGKSPQRADIILLTHEHYDHYSEKDIRLISNDSTRVVAPMSLPTVTDHISPGETLTIQNVSIQAIPAYNLSKSFHPKEKSWVGYVIDMGGKKIYHTGDTDRIPEMKDIAVDIAFLPVGGTYTMDALEASEAAKDISARFIIPIHFGDIVGSHKDAQKLADLSECNINILQPGESLNLD
jgi:L-ascorbate metabolism protein UlaG (beta-lactamase superfamily)